MPAPPSLGDYTLVTGTEQSEFLAAFQSKNERIHSARGRYELEISKGFRRDQVTQVVAFERPDKLRLEVFASSLNQLILMLVAKEDFIEALDPKEGVLYRAVPTPASVFQLLSVPLVPEELELWFAGMVYLPPDADIRILRHPVDNTFAIEGKTNFNRIVRARFAKEGGDHLRMLTFELARVDGSGAYFFSEMFYDGEDDIPNQITFHIPAQSISGSLIRKSFALNPDHFPEKLFNIPKTDELRIEPVIGDPNY